MLKKEKLIYGLIVFLLTAFLVLPLNAATLTIEDVYIGYGHHTSYDKLNGKKVGMNPILYDGAADKYKAINSGAGLLQVSDYNGYGSTWGFCVDLGTPVGFGQNSFDANAGTTVSNQNYVEWLLDSYADDALTYSTNGAALQLAIWEVVNDDESLWNYDAGSGDLYKNEGDTKEEKFQNFYYGRGAANRVDENLNAWYDYYMGTLTDAIDEGIFVDGYESDGKYIVANLSQDGENTQNVIINVVPEPTTMLLFGFGLLGMGAIGRRRQS